MDTVYGIGPYNKSNLNLYKRGEHNQSGKKLTLVFQSVKHGHCREVKADILNMKLPLNPAGTSTRNPGEK